MWILVEIMAQFNHSSSHSGEGHTILLELYCLPKFSNGGKRNELIYLVVINIALSVTTTLGNTVILMVLQKESSLHAPSKLLLRSLTISDLFVGLTANPLTAATLVLESQKRWDIWRYLSIVCFSSAHVFCSVSLLTTTAISVDRLLALQLMLRYRQIVTLRACICGYNSILALFHCQRGLAISWNIYRNVDYYDNILVFNHIGFFVLKNFLSIASVHDCTRTTPNQTSRSESNPLDITRYRKTVSRLPYLCAICLMLLCS